MKKIIFFLLSVLTVQTFAQEGGNRLSQIPYTTYNLKFAVADESEPATDVFGNEKSYWTFNYELRFLNSDKDSQYKAQSADYYANLSQTEREKALKENNKNYDKFWKKSSKLIAKGKVEKKFLSTLSNRQLIIPVALSEEVKNMLAKATDTWENPAYRVSMKGKLFIRTADGAKLKQKISQSYVCNSKMQTKEIQAWMINSCGIYTGIKKQNGKITTGSSSVMN